MRQPKVGIYMSCYNHEKYVAEAMDSIVGQTYANWELFVANDGSADGTGEILAAYEDRRIHYFDFKENTKFVGVAEFLQGKLRESDAEYIAIMSSDDKWEPDKLESQIAVFQKYPEYRAVFTWDKLLFTQEDYYKDRLTYSHERNRSRYDWMWHFYYAGNCLNSCSMLMEREAFFEFGGFNHIFLGVADYRLWMQFVSKYPFYLMDRELTYYRRHESNLSSGSAETFLRTQNESCAALFHVIRGMSADCFHRTFYGELMYTGCVSDEELLAEKFILLADVRYATYEQAAIMLYLSNCDNRLFTEILEKNYSFSPGDFIEFNANSGLQFIANTVYGQEVLAQKERKNCVPADFILNEIDRGRLNEKTLGAYRYSALRKLYEVIVRLENGERQFAYICGTIKTLRERSRAAAAGRSIVLIAAEDTKIDVRAEAAAVCEPGDTCKVAFVPTAAEGFLQGAAWKSQKEETMAGVPVIRLFDAAEHCVRFLWEVDESADIIYYIDCLSEAYECGKMAFGYGLDVEQRCILSGDAYRAQTAERNALSAIMERIEER